MFICFLKALPDLTKPKVKFDEVISHFVKNHLQNFNLDFDKMIFDKVCNSQPTKGLAIYELMIYVY
jgi:hypothetical protein